VGHTKSFSRLAAPVIRPDAGESNKRVDVCICKQRLVKFDEAGTQLVTMRCGGYHVLYIGPIYVDI
jgi:hypothetical protein